jgi:bcr-type benzoyl-CoA reductase subunit B
MFPEVTALQNAIRHRSLPLILKAEQAGYSSDNCAYVKADVGLVLDGGMGPGAPIPFPSIVVCNYVGCNVYVKWFEHLADIAGAPLFMLDVPFARTDRFPEADVRYVVAQLRELIARCESLTGRRFDIDELRERLALSARAQDGYARCKHLTKHRPAPYDSYFDSINMMGPINVLRGTAEAADFFDAAVAEFERLAAERVGPLSEERFRTVVEGPPPYPYYKSFRNLFTKWGAVAVQSTYSTVGGIWEFGFRHDPRRPLESIAEQMLRENLTARSSRATRRSSATSRSGRRTRSSSTPSSRAGSSRRGRATCASTSRGSSGCRRCSSSPTWRTRATTPRRRSRTASTPSSKRSSTRSSWRTEAATRSPSATRRSRRSPATRAGRTPRSRPRAR